MATPNPTDSDQPIGTQSANSAASTPAGVQPNSQNTETVPAWAKELIGDVRALKGDKDRGVNRVSKKLDEIAPILERVKRITGMDDAQASALQRELEYDEIRSRVLGGQETQPASPASQGSGAGPAAQIGEWDVLNLFGVKETDEGVMDALREAGGDAHKLHAALLSRQVSATAKPQPTPASNAALNTGSGVPSQNTDALYAELEPLYKNMTQNGPRIASILNQLREAGEPV